MRSLNCEHNGVADVANNDKPELVVQEIANGRAFYEENLKRLRVIHHSKCLFNRQSSIVPGLQFCFDNTGKLLGEFSCDRDNQGYDGMVHGGVIAAVIDSSMAQCLMGHGVVAYTANLSVKYRKPVRIDTKTTLTTSITTVNCGLLYSMNCEIIQNRNIVVQAKGSFFKVK